MQPQGASPINLAYFNSIISQANAVAAQTLELERYLSPAAAQARIQAELQTLANQAMSDLQAQISGINQQVGVLAPVQALATMSLANIGDVISFCTSFQSQILGPQLLAFESGIATLAGTLAQIGVLTAAINSAASSAGVTVSVPIVSVSTIGAASGAASVAGYPKGVATGACYGSGNVYGMART